MPELKATIRSYENRDQEVYYRIEVEREGKKWTLWRRYSQFYELYNKLWYEFPVTQSYEFPGKVWWGGTSDKVCQERVQKLKHYLDSCLSNQMISDNHLFLSFLEATDELVVVGQDAPDMEFTDINGKVVKSSSFPNESTIFIWCAANQYNYKDMVSLLEVAHTDVLKKHSQTFNQKLVYFAVADMSAVPSFLQNQALPVIRLVNNSNQSKMSAMYTNVHMDPPPFFFIPDWDGSILKKLGCADVQWTYRLWVAVKGKVVGTFQSATPNASQAYIKMFDDLAETLKSL